jgi:hypothetical protein
MTMISKSYSDSSFGGNPGPLDKVEIFRDRVMSWQIDIGKEIVRQIDAAQDKDVMKHAGYALLSILVNYFEMYWQYKQGHTSENASKAYFAWGFADVYPNFPMSHEDIKKEVYPRLRCGMYHDGFTKRGVTIDSHYTQGCDYDAANDEIKINPHMMVDTIESHFAAYIATLQTDATALQGFLLIFDRFMPGPASSSPPSVVPPSTSHTTTPATKLPVGTESGVRRPTFP